MLAYVFRHWPSQGTDRGGYEVTHLQFHQSIANESPPGFHRSFVFRLEKAPWIAATGPIYEDWYLVENFAALESRTKVRFLEKIALLTTVLRSAQVAEPARFMGFELESRTSRRYAWLSGFRSREACHNPNSMPAFPGKLWTPVGNSGSVRWFSDLPRSVAYCWRAGQLFQRRWTQTKSNWNWFGVAIDWRGGRLSLVSF